jgi:hypothetical protein
MVDATFDKAGPIVPMLRALSRQPSSQPRVVLPPLPRRRRCQAEEGCGVRRAQADRGSVLQLEQVVLRGVGVHGDDPPGPARQQRQRGAASGADHSQAAAEGGPQRLDLEQRVLAHRCEEEWAVHRAGEAHALDSRRRGFERRRMCRHDGAVSVRAGSGAPETVTL